MYYFTIRNEKTGIAFYASAPVPYPVESDLNIDSIEIEGEANTIENARFIEAFIQRHFKVLRRIIWREIFKRDTEGVPHEETICGHDLQ